LGAEKINQSIGITNFYPYRERAYRLPIIRFIYYKSS